MGGVNICEILVVKFLKNILVAEGIKIASKSAGRISSIAIRQKLESFYWKKIQTLTHILSNS